MPPMRRRNSVLELFFRWFHRLFHFRFSFLYRAVAFGVGGLLPLLGGLEIRRLGEFSKNLPNSKPPKLPAAKAIDPKGHIADAPRAKRTPL